MKTNTLYNKNYHSYQPTLPLDFTVSYDVDIPNINATINMYKNDHIKMYKINST